jgi:hypothetical protein
VNINVGTYIIQTRRVAIVSGYAESAYGFSKIIKHTTTIVVCFMLQLSCTADRGGGDYMYQLAVKTKEPKAAPVSGPKPSLPASDVRI